MRRKCTPNQNWACFVRYLKIINIGLKKNISRRWGTMTAHDCRTTFFKENHNKSLFKLIFCFCLLMVFFFFFSDKLRKKYKEKLIITKKNKQTDKQTNTQITWTSSKDKCLGTFFCSFSFFLC